MRYLTLIVVLFFLFSCKPNRSTQKKIYTATDKESVALLTLNIGEDFFYGHYEVLYPGKAKDSGEVRGVIIGDTLDGRYKYISYGGSQQLKPFMLLKRGEILKLGNGAIASYMRIPYYIPKSIEFKDSSFQFYPIDKNRAKKMNLIIE